MIGRAWQARVAGDGSSGEGGLSICRQDSDERSMRARSVRACACVCVLDGLSIRTAWASLPCQALPIAAYESPPPRPIPPRSGPSAVTAHDVHT